MAKKAKLSESELAAIVQRRKETGLNYNDGELSSRRENLLERYLGKPYGTERDGQSKVVTRQCLEAVEWTIPSLLRVFMSSPQIAEFVPVSPEDEEPAKMETIALNDVFFKKNDGFMVAYSWIKDTLMNMNGYIKVYWDEREKVTTEEYEGLTGPEVMQLLMEPGVEAVEQESRLVVVDSQMGQMEMEQFDLKIRRTQDIGKVVIESIAPEDLVIDDKLTEVSLEKADFVCHTVTKSRSDLVEMGFDKELVYSLPSMTEEDDESRSRHDAISQQGVSLDHNETSDESTELIEVDDAYLYIDYDGDGVAEFRHVMTVGEEVLENEECNMLPIVGMTAVPMPHSHVGLSWMELVEDLQKIYTTLTRQLLNNLYRTNNPRTIVGRGVNISDLMNDLPNAPIRAENIENIRVEPTQSVIGQVLPALQQLDDMGERRTGVSKSTMGLDADSLSRVTKGAFLGSLEQANQRLEALARIMAESGFKPLLLKVHQLMKMHQKDAYQAKIAGQWVGVNPSEWRERDDMTITVGLGTGNKQAQMMALEKVWDAQVGLMMNGQNGVLVNEQNMFNTASRLIEVTGLHNPEKYFVDPSKQPPKQPEPPQPDAAMELVKVEMAKVQQKAQADSQKMQLEMQQLQAKLMEKSRELDLKAKDLEIKEYKVLLDSEAKQAQIDQSTAQLNAQQNVARGEMDD